MFPAMINVIKCFVREHQMLSEGMG